MVNDKNKIPNKIAIYSRKSKFTGKGESIENQIELCKQYIAVHFPQFNESDVMIFEDEGFSGGHMDRPQFQQMMRKAENKEFTHIVCYRLDRISRNIGDFAKLIEELNQLNIGFISIKEQFDTSSPMGRAMMYIASVFSQLERETIAERIRDNMQELAKTGRWLGGTTPTGYQSESTQKVTVDGKIRKAFKLTIIPEEAQLVKLIYDKFIETNSLTQTETFLIQRGIMTKNNRNFTRFAIKNILENPVYMIADKESYAYFTEQGLDLFATETDFDSKHGIMAYNKTVQTRGKANETRDMGDWIIAVGKHTGLVSGIDWIRVQKQLEQNKSKSYRKPKSNVALLSGLLFCGNCGDYMRPKLSQRKNTKGEYIYNYLCAMKERSRMHNCDIKNPNGNMLDALVCNEIKKLSEEPSAFIWELQNCQKILSQDATQNDAELARLHKLYSDTEIEIKALVTTLSRASGTASEEYIMAQIEELDGKCKGIRQNIDEMESLTKQHELSDIEFDILRDILSSFKNTFDNMNIEQKRAALRTFVRKVVWDGENVHIYLFGSRDEDIELPPLPSDDTDIEPLCEDSK
ncbi:MAG: recombinase family protein [Oscillospiraceae bacterium]